MHALFLAVFTLVAQGPTAPSTSLSYPDRVIIDAASIVRDHGARSVTELLISRVPGLLVVPGSGLTGGGAQLRFAGARTSFGNAAPLVLVDGIRFDAGEDATVMGVDGPGPLRLDDIDVEQIESVEVLRGPASATRYGPGAAGGVILIRTKRSQSQALRWEAYAQGSVRVYGHRWPGNYGAADLDNPNTSLRGGFCDLVNQASGACTPDLQQSFNPLVQHNPFATPVQRRAGIAASGGSSWGSARLAASFDGDGSAYATPRVPVHDNDFGRSDLRASAVLRPHAAVEVELAGNRLHSTLGLPLYRPIYDGLRGPSASAGFSWDSVGASYQEYPRSQATRRDGLSVEARIRPLRWLVARVRHGFDDVTSREAAEYASVLSPTYDTVRSSATRRVRQGTTQVEVSGVEKWGPARFTTTFGTERLGYRLHRSERVFCDTVRCSEAGTEMWRNTAGWYALEDVAVGGRFTATVAWRRDRFKELRRSVTRRSVAVGWVARQSDSGALGRVQLRAAYGSAGSLNFAGLESADFFLILLPLERTKGVEVGAAAGFFGDRWNTHVSVYDLQSDANSVGVSPSFGGVGAASYVPDGLRLSNRGIVASLSGPVIEQESFTWRAQLSLWGNRNRVTKAPSRFGFMPGYPFGGYWARSIVSFADANGDGIIVPAEVTRSGPVWAGTPYPTQGAMLTSAWRLGRWRAATTLDYRAGHTLFNEREWWRCFAMPVCRQRYDARTPLADQAAAVAASDPLTDYYEDADYLKLREIAVTFDVPPNAAAAIGARAASITLAARDLFTWTGYSGGDPEAGSYARLLDPSFGAAPQISDLGVVPLARSWSLGVRIAF